MAVPSSRVYCGIMKLFDNAFSPFAFKVRVALYEKGLDFEQRALRTAAEREELRRLNPRDEVPALEDGGAVIYDSTVICEYLDDRYPSPSLRPVDPAERARCRALELISDTQLDGCLFVMGLLKASDELQRRVPGALPRAAAILAKHHANLERALAEGEHLVGELSIADIAVYPHLRSAAFLGYPVGDGNPRLRAWMDRMGARASIRRATREMARAFQEFRTDPAPFFSRDRVHWRNDRLEWGVRCGLGPWVQGELDAGRAFFSSVP